ncbi:class II fructose-bisphosphate aldolase [Nesterenkonia lutea]|uniref:Tagatose 1,6-diphosphate aldolase GatY/KbaY n=1 Tax=Nesterenkonia lutea TaxID=272919 RepID=A0ABR9JD15_9MICC|nr:class II fructose-bisphosphate aldolase [Nesterenkonia lutea]MBE1523678.1 tagatose 1,6-diphosphate aldolase GatY/KbaY [Nesterenkonia lutea]
MVVKPVVAHTAGRFMREMVQRAVARDSAVPAFAVYDFGTAQAIVEASEKVGSAVILLVPPKVAGGIGGLRFIQALRCLADDISTAVSVQLDHATDLSLIDSAVRAGADAVLADGSRLSMEANAEFVAQTREIVGNAVTLEAELGNIAGDEDIALQSRASPFTDAGEVADFLRLSGADLLAVSVGNVHGQYSGEPKLGWGRIAELKVAAANVPLVLHGASGLSEQDLAAAPAAGIGKINFNTELRVALFDMLRSEIDGHIDRGFDMVGLQRDWHDKASGFALATLRRLSP